MAIKKYTEKAVPFRILREKPCKFIDRVKEAYMCVPETLEEAIEMAETKGFYYATRHGIADTYSGKKYIEKCVKNAIKDFERRNGK